jgi:hypothetical protein
MEKIIYSANIGGYDDLTTPKIYDKNIRYILFTDNKYFRSKVWEICHVDFLDNNWDNRKKSRYLKLNPHNILPEHDISLWIDGNFTSQIENFQEFLNLLDFDKKKEFMLYKHRLRNCTYEESKRVVELGKESVINLNLQINKYKNENFPENLGLFETGFLLRSNSENTKKFNDLWWNEMINGSMRDQISLMYTSWKLNIKLHPILIGNSVYKNPFVQSYDHNYDFKI